MINEGLRWMQFLFRFIGFVVVALYSWNIIDNIIEYLVIIIFLILAIQQILDRVREIDE